LLGIAGIVSACGVAEVRLIPPTLSNVVHQDTYCTDRDTIMDFKFNKDGLLTRLEVTLVPADFNGANPSTDPRAVTEEANPFDLDNNSFKGWAVLNSNGIAGIQSVSQNGVGGQSVKVSGGSWQVWVRGFNGGETKGFVKSDKLLTPSTGPSCDPIFPYDNP